MKIKGDLSVLKNIECTKIDIDNIEIDGNTLSSTNSNGNIIIIPNGTGKIRPNNAYSFASSDGSINQFQQTNGSGVLSWGDYGIGSQNFSGFKSWSGSGNYFSTSGTNFTLLRGGTGFIKNVEITFAGSQTVSSLTAGNTHFIYIDSSGIIGSTTTRSLSLFQNYIVLFEVFVDSTPVTPNLIVVKENHPFSFPASSSEWAHDVIGEVIENKNNGANITLNGTKSIQINGSDELEDHGLDTDIPDSLGSAVTFNFMYTNASGKWVVSSSGTTFASSYNNSGTITALGSGKFGVFRLYVSKDNLNSSIPVYFAVYDTVQYNTLSAAQTAVSNGTPASQSSELSALELVQLGLVIKKESTDTIIQVYIQKATSRSSILSGTSNVASLVTTSVTNFNGWLTSADTNVQASLETLDDKFINTNARIFTLNGISSGYASSENIAKQISIQTSGNTPTDLIQIAMSVGEMLSLEARVNGFKSDYSQCFGARIFATFRRSTAGNVTVVGVPVIDICEDAAGTDVTIIADTVNQEATVQITGITAETWNWVATFNYNKTLSNA